MNETTMDDPTVEAERQAERVEERAEAAADARGAFELDQAEERALKRDAKDQANAEAADDGAAALQAIAARDDNRFLPASTGRVIPGTNLPIVPTQREMAGLAAMAVTLSAANALPSALRNRPNDVFLVLLTARDLGIAVTTAIREFHVIDGKVTLSPKSKLAMLNERGNDRGWAVWPDPTNNSKTATWHATRADRPGVEFSSTFTWENAITAKLHNKDNWQGYPQRMLSWRALGYLLDDVFPEVGTGLYSPDEMGALTDENGDPVIDVNSMEPLMGMKGPKGSNSGGGGGGSTTETPAPAEEKDALRFRLDNLKPERFETDPTYNGPTARDALMQLWLAKDADGNPRDGGQPLPPWNSLTVGQIKKATAMIKGIEDRATKGEWGEWRPVDPETGEMGGGAPTGAAQTTDEGTTPVATPPDGSTHTEEGTDQPPADAPGVQGERTGESAQDTAPTTDGPAEGEPGGPGPDLADQVIAEVQALKWPAQVKAECAKRSLSPNGAESLVRQRLATALLQERMASSTEEA